MGFVTIRFQNNCSLVVASILNYVALVENRSHVYISDLRQPKSLAVLSFMQHNLM